MLEEHRVVKEMKKMKEKNKEQLIVALFGKNPKNRENKVIRELEKIERKGNEKKSLPTDSFKLAIEKQREKDLKSTSRTRQIKTRKLTYGQFYVKP